MNATTFRPLFLATIACVMMLHTQAFASQAGCVLTPDDFKKTASSIASRSSNRAYVATLKNDQCSYSAGSKWVIKENPLALGIAEYIAAALYQRILGKECVGDTIWIQDGKKKIGYIATQFRDKFWPFPGRYGGANAFRKFEFYATFEGVWVKNGITGSILTKAPQKTSAAIKPVVGVELATFASVLMDDIDCEDGWNFALTETPNTFCVTRYDFDGSLKFLERLGYSKGRAGYGRAANYESLLDPSSGAGTQHEMPYWGKFRRQYFPLVSSVNATKLLSALERIGSISPDEIKEIVNKQWQTAVTHQSTNTLGQAFNFPVHENVNTIIPNQIVALLRDRQAALKNMQRCLAFEVAMKDDVHEHMSLLLLQQTPAELSQMNCTSLYGSYYGPRAKPLRTMIERDGYSNRATKLLLDYLDKEDKQEL